MLDPPGSLDDLVVMADWVELSVATLVPAQVDRMSVGETLDAAGVMGMQDGGLPPGDLNWMDEDALTPEDESDRYTELVWQELDRRSFQLGSAYPFIVDGDGLRMRVEGWRLAPAYTFLLLLDYAKVCPEINVKMTPNSPQALLFEKVVEAAATGIFRGRSQRFGWPREPDWPKPIVERLGKLGEMIGLSVEENLAGKLTADDKDKGLDVVASLGLGSSYDSTVWFLFQCACGDNWREKCGEPSLSEWRDLLVWQGQLVRGLALPWRLEQPWDMNRTGRKFDAVVLERDRLLGGSPDSRLDESTRTRIVAWCEPIIRDLPYVDRV